MKGWLLDTNVISAVSGPQPEPRVATWFKAQPEHTLFLSILTLAEYQKGIEHLPPGHSMRSRHRQTLIRLEARFVGRILSLSNAIVLRWGSISGEVNFSFHPAATNPSYEAGSARVESTLTNR